MVIVRKSKSAHHHAIQQNHPNEGWWDFVLDQFVRVVHPVMLALGALIRRRVEVALSPASESDIGRLQLCHLAISHRPGSKTMQNKLYESC